MADQQALARAAKAVLRSSLRIRPRDRVLVIFDVYGHDIAHALAVAASRLQLDNFCARLVPLKEQMRCSRTRRIPRTLRTCVSDCSVLIFAVSAYDKTTTFRAKVLTAAVRGKARIAHMPGVSVDLLVSTVSGSDFSRIYATAKRLKAALLSTRAVAVQTRTASGEVKTLHIRLASSARRFHYCGGIAEPGEIMNIPTGEVYCAPYTGSAKGDLVLNGSATHCIFREHDQPILHFRQGRLDLELSHFPALPNSRRFARTLRRMSKRNPENMALGELGIGLNRRISKLVGNMISDEKAAGTAHIALGSNTPFNGPIDVDWHEDLVFYPCGILLGGHPLRTKWQPVVPDTLGASNAPD